MSLVETFEISRLSQYHSAAAIAGKPIAAGPPADGDVLTYNAATGQFEFGPGIPLVDGTPSERDTIIYDSAQQKFIYSPGLIVQTGDPNDGDHIVYDAAQQKFVYAPSLDVAAGTPNAGDTIIYDSGAGEFIYSPGLIIDTGVAANNNFLRYDSGLGKWVYSPGFDLQTGTPNNGDAMVYNSVSMKFEYKPASTAGTVVFNANNSVAQAIGAGSIPVVTNFDTIRFDPGSNFNTGTGAFTAPVTGYYFFNAIVNTTLANNLANIQLWKNGVFERVLDNNLITFNPVLSGNAFVSLAAGDVITIISSTVGAQDMLPVEFSGFLVAEA